MTLLMFYPAIVLDQFSLICTLLSCYDCILEDFDVDTFPVAWLLGDSMPGILV